MGNPVRLENDRSKLKAILACVSTSSDPNALGYADSVRRNVFEARLYARDGDVGSANEYLDNATNFGILLGVDVSPVVERIREAAYKKRNAVYSKMIIGELHNAGRCAGLDDVQGAREALVRVEGYAEESGIEVSNAVNAMKVLLKRFPEFESSGNVSIELRDPASVF